MEEGGGAVVGRGIDADAPLNYATLQIFPTQNRYEVLVCVGNQEENVANGLLDQLVPHLPGVKDLCAQGSNVDFKLEPPEPDGLKNAPWFTKSTLSRFIQIIGLPDLVNTIKVITGEMSQLEEARKFHSSLYAQGHLDHFEGGKPDGCNSTEISPKLKPKVKIATADTSKNELLQAMDLRLTALRRELATAVNQAAGATFSSKEVTNLVGFCQHFGATDLKNYLSKFLELSQNSETYGLLNDDRRSFSYMSRIAKVNTTGGDTQSSRPMYSETLVKYGTSPAIVAQVERQSSTESEESSFSDSSNENELSAERSRAPIRFAPPRRSASPMRRIQIGRTGSRRAAGVTIKNLSNFPTRERISPHGAVNSTEVETSENRDKKPENDVRRMSVQDAINLFESKKKDQTADVQKGCSLSNVSHVKNISEFTRSSADVLKCSSPHQPGASVDSVSALCNDLVDGDVSKHFVKEKLEGDCTSGCPVETGKVHVELERVEERADNLEDIEKDTNSTKIKENNGRLTSSAEWSKQKEVELNQLLTMMESQPVRTMKPHSTRDQNMPNEQRGGFYDHRKGKRDGKLQRVAFGQREERVERLRAMQQLLAERKTEKDSAKVKDVGKRHSSRNPPKSIKNTSQPMNSKNDSPIASVKRVSSKTTALPATRKSWPSTPSAKGTGSSPSKVPAGISTPVTLPTHRKPLSKQSLSVSSANAEMCQPFDRNTKETLTSDRKLKYVKEKMQRAQPKSQKATTKTKATVVARDHSGSLSNSGYCNKETKKSSVVPLESKPFLRKGSRVGTVVGPSTNKTKHSSMLGESKKSCQNMSKHQESKEAGDASVLLCMNQDGSILPMAPSDTAVESNRLVNSPGNPCEVDNSKELATDGDGKTKDVAEVPAKCEALEELIISLPTACVEEEAQRNSPNSYDNGSIDLASLDQAATVGLSSPRNRLSLLQMLQEDCSESDSAEWGIAENPPAVVWQKDAPKGLKKLLKFARKSKGEGNVAGWSSPSAFSDGEDNAEVSKDFSWRNTDNELRKKALRSDNYGQQNASITAGFPAAEPNVNKLVDRTSESSDKWHRSGVSDPASTTKATRSFFTLSAFRGNKANETKFP